MHRGIGLLQKCIPCHGCGMLIGLRRQLVQHLEYAPITSGRSQVIRFGRTRGVDLCEQPSRRGSRDYHGNRWAFYRIGTGVD